MLPVHSSFAFYFFSPFVLFVCCFVQCEFHNGILVCCNGAVNIRRESATQISIRGALCEEYFRIRSMLYRQYEIV